MKLGKAIFVTLLVAGMAAAIILCLYALQNPGYLVLIGAVVLYGFMRAALDFCTWLRKVDSFNGLDAPDEEEIAARPEAERVASMMQVLNDDV